MSNLAILNLGTFIQVRLTPKRYLTSNPFHNVTIFMSIFRDHKTVYVGDAKGRIFSWTVADQPGKVVADHWLKDDGTDSCHSCNVRFTFSERRHHCRNCGQVFCSK